MYGGMIIFYEGKKMKIRFTKINNRNTNTTINLVIKRFILLAISVP